MNPKQRGNRVAREVCDAIAPRLEQGHGPVDLVRLAERVAEEIEAALAEDRRGHQPSLFPEE